MGCWFPEFLLVLLLLLLLCTHSEGLVSKGLTEATCEKEEESSVILSMELQPYEARYVTTPVYVCVRAHSALRDTIILRRFPSDIRCNGGRHTKQAELTYTVGYYYFIRVGKLAHAPTHVLT